MEKKLEAIVRKFMADNEITHEEMIYDTDSVIENAYDFMAELCGAVGFPDEEDV